MTFGPKGMCSLHGDINSSTIWPGAVEGNDDVNDLYHIKYTDGDSEDLSEHELLIYIV